MTRLYLYGGIGILLLSLMAYGYIEHNRFIKARLELNTFIATTEALQAKQERDHAEAIHTALAERDAALVSLHNSQERTRQLQASLTAGSSGKVCFRTEGFDAFLSGVAQLIEAGDRAVMDNKAWLSAWPK